MNIDPIWNYIVARQMILLRRQAGESPPWTNDPILSRYSFCNVYREDDRTTIWCKEHVRDRWKNAPYHILALAIAVFRNFNRIKAGEALFDTPAFEIWTRQGDIDILKQHLYHHCGFDGPFFTGAYIIRSENGMTKLDAVLKHLPSHAEILQREIFNPILPATCQQVFDRLVDIDYMGKFSSAQLIADFKYTKLLANATDWYTFVASGPGSRRGLNIVLGKDPDVRWQERDWKANILELMSLLHPRFAEMGWQLPHAQDIQNICCEFAKYTRGFSRNQYIPGAKL